MKTDEFIEHMKEIILAPDAIIRKADMRKAIKIIETQRECINLIEKKIGYTKREYIERVAQQALEMEI